MMDKELTTALEQIFEATHILSTSAFRFADGPIHTSAEMPMVGAMPGAPTPSQPLISVMAGVLYTTCYAHRFPGAPAQSPFGLDPSLPMKMDQANTSQETWDYGWHVYAVGADGTVSLQKGEVQMAARPGEYLSTNNRHAMPVVGEQVNVFMPRGSHTTQPGFYYMFGETPIDIWSDHALFRFYFKTTPTGVGALISWVMTTLNGFQVPFRMKSLVEAAHYSRSDTTVLYVSRAYASIVARLLQDPSFPLKEAELADPVPLFTLPLAQGIGIADDPGSHESFGMHRCRLICEAMMDEFAQGRTSAEYRMLATSTRFARQGMDLERPWLGANRSDIFAQLCRLERVE
ncbi:MAG: T3SS effector HopA1 family protein [Litoreibacter sp.]